MKLLRLALIAFFAACLAPAAPAQSTASRNTVVRIAPRAQAEPKAAAAGQSYSVEVPYVRSYAPPGGGQGGTLVLNQAHSFNITLAATDQRTGNTGPGVSLPQTDTFGYFSLPALTSNPSNPEVFVKILDGRRINGSYWVFYGHLTDLIYDLTVTDNVTGVSKTYHKDAGNTAGGFDTGSFPAPSVTTTNTKAAPGTLPDAYVRTSVDISNNTTTDGVTATLQYCYALNDVWQGGCTTALPLSLGHLDTFHSDDIVSYLGSQGKLAPGAEQNSLGTLLVTFDQLPSRVGWEGTVTASTYNRVSEVDPLRGTVGCGEPASLFFESALTSLVGTARDTVPSPSLQAGSLGSTLGIHNTDALGKSLPVTVDVTLYDAASGQPVGSQITLSNIAPGELRLINDLFSQAAVPPNVSSVIVFADTRNTSTNAATIEGFLLTQDTDSGDTRFHELKCAAGCSPF